jgi:hypothetical protein
VAERLRDADLLKALPYAKGGDRELLIIGLAHSEGTEGSAQLRRLCATETGHARSAALSALAQRCGAAATDLLSEALRSRSIEVQGTAALALAQHGTADAADAVFEWLHRTLGRKRREANWDPYELPSAIRFAVRHGLHAEVARIIATHWVELDRDEQHWLRRTWPTLFDRTGSPVVAPDVRPPDQVQGSVFEDERGASRRDEPEAWEKYYGDDIRKALKKAIRKSASR